MKLSMVVILWHFSSPEDIAEAEVIVFPGVGSFGSAMEVSRECMLHCKPLLQSVLWCCATRMIKQDDTSTVCEVIYGIRA